MTRKTRTVPARPTLPQRLRLKCVAEGDKTFGVFIPNLVAPVRILPYYTLGSPAGAGEPNRV